MLTVTGLTKRFGSATAVHDVSFTIQPGEILGLIGQNGAGKTTTFRMLLNLLQADHGNMTWNDQPLSLLSRETIGYLPEERGLYPKMTVVDQICFFGELHGMKRAAVMAVLDQWLDQFQVKGKPTDLVKDLSKGNQQKVQLIAAMIHNPQFIILDEPFSGLDPVNAGLLEAGIRRLRDAGSAIIYSSHDMGNVEAISDKLVMLKMAKSFYQVPSMIFAINSAKLASTFNLLSPKNNCYPSPAWSVSPNAPEDFSLNWLSHKPVMTFSQRPPNKVIFLNSVSKHLP